MRDKGKVPILNIGDKSNILLERKFFLLKLFYKISHISERDVISLNSYKKYKKYVQTPN